MSKYALISNNSVRYVDLRETKNYLINDKTGDRYKKVGGKDYIASNLKFKDWTWFGDHVYECNHQKVIDKVAEIKQLKFIKSVNDALNLKLKSIGYDDALDINEKLNLGVEL